MSQIAKPILQDDVFTFQKNLRESFDTLFNDLLTEAESTLEDKTVEAIKQLVSSAKHFNYKTGVAYFEVLGPTDAKAIGDKLDKEDSIEGYDMYVNGDSDEVDFGEIEDSHTVGFVVYLKPEFVQYETPTDDDDEGYGDVSEIKRVIKVNSMGVKRVKMKCGHGFKFNTASKTCEKITGAQLATIRKAVRKTLITKRSEGTALKTRIKRKTLKADRFRKAFGLK